MTTSDSFDDERDPQGDLTGGGEASVLPPPVARNFAVEPPVAPPPVRVAPPALSPPPVRPPAAARVFAEPPVAAVVAASEAPPLDGGFGGFVIDTTKPKGKVVEEQPQADGEAEGEDAEGVKGRKRSFFDFAPPWLISLVVHLIIIISLAIVVTPVGDGLNSLLLTIGQSDLQSDGEFTEFQMGQDEVIDVNDAMDLEPLAPVDLLSSAEMELDGEKSELVEFEKGLGEEILPVAKMFVGRSGAMRKTLLSVYGGTAKTEDAVELGLKWLTRQQGRDGSWSIRGPYGDGASGENKVAATAMALLAFLGAGHTHQGGEYRGTVSKGIKWLVEQQDRDGFFCKEGASHQRTYAQAQSSIVVCELYGMTEDSWLREPAQLALNYAQRAQGPDGGWRYQPGDPGDTSVTGWYVMALQSGMASGLEVDQSVLYKVRNYLDEAAVGDGSEYAYQPGGAASAAMSAEGLLCRQYLGWEHSQAEMITGVNRLVDQDWMFTREDNNVYYWYYATQVLHHFGGSQWKAWNDLMKEELPDMQVKQGREAGSWAPQRDRWASVSGGRLMMTCFSIYCLEVYYRHMPLYQGGKNKDDAKTGG